MEDVFCHWFNQEEIKDINANNEQYQLLSPEEELLLTWFEPGTLYGNFPTSELSVSACSFFRLFYVFH